MPLLFCLAVHNPLAAIQDQLGPREHVFAFLDDTYVVSLPERTRAIFNLAAEKLGEGAGIELHAGKTRVWNRVGGCPLGMEELGPEVWNAAGFKILGTPVGTAEFEHAVCAARSAEEDKLWKAIKWIPDLQCAWQVLVQCAGPRCHHFLRTMPPSSSAQYAEGHDVGMQQAMELLMEGMPGDARQQEVATQIASLPMRMGGLGIRSASRMAPAAFWASWADALPTLQERLPSISDQIADVLEGGTGARLLGRASNSHTSARSQRCRQPSRVARIAGGSTSSPSTRVRA